MSQFSNLLKYWFDFNIIRNVALTNTFKSAAAATHASLSKFLQVLAEIPLHFRAE